MENPNYYAIIPAKVRYCSELSASEKLLYGEITALCGKDGVCWATNKYFAKLYGVSERSITVWIANLVKFGFIKSDVKKDKGNVRYIMILSAEEKNDCIENNFGSLEENFHSPMEENFGSPIEENFGKNNINNNNINNNNIYTSNKLDKSDILSLWNRLAEKWGFSKISIVSDERQQKIKARLKDSGCETLYEMFKRIDEAIMGSLFLRGKKQRWVNGEWVLENADWRPDFDFFTRKSKFIKAIDGGYDDNDVIEKKNEGKWEQYKNWMNKNWGEF